MAKPRRNIHNNATNELKVTTELTETSIGKIEIPSIGSKTTIPVLPIQKTTPIQAEPMLHTTDFLEYISTGQVVYLTKENTIFDWNEINKITDMLFIDLEDEEKIQSCKNKNIPFIPVIDILNLKIKMQEILEFLKKHSIFICVISIEMCERSELTKCMEALRAAGIEIIGYFMSDGAFGGIGPDISQVDFIWLSHYRPGSPKYPCHFHAFTNEGNLKGADGNVIISKATPNSKKTTEWLREIGKINLNAY